jgi:two-component system sensor histidine kinase and response regulator WspE
MTSAASAITGVLQSEATPQLSALRRHLLALAVRCSDAGALAGASAAAASVHALAQLAEHALLVRAARALHERLSAAERGAAALDQAAVVELDPLLALCERALSTAGAPQEHAGEPAELLAFEARLRALEVPSLTEPGGPHHASPAPAVPCDTRLLALFREDLASCAGQLGAQLVQLEAASDKQAPLERLMRAAHSLKGAARAVGIDPLVDLLNGLVRIEPAELELEFEARAGEMHQHALAARALRGERAPAPSAASTTVSDAAQARAAGPRLADIAGACAVSLVSDPARAPAERPVVARSVADAALANVAVTAPLQSPARQARSAASHTAQPPGGRIFSEPPPAFAPSLPDASSSPSAAAWSGAFSDPPTRLARPLPAGLSHPPQAHAAGLAAASLSQAPAPRVSVAASDPPLPVGRSRALPAKPPDNDVSDERAVRVTARSIERLVGLSAEALVQARRTETFSGAIGQLKQRQAALLDRIELRAGAAQDAELREQIEECRRVTGELAPALDLYVRAIEDLTGRLYHEALQSRMRPFSEAVQSLPRLARDAARRLDKRVTLSIAGERTRVDRDVLEALQLPLQHLVRNAIDHGLEPADERVARGKPATGALRVEARHHAGTLAITVSDDGRGVDLIKLRQKLVETQRISAEHALQLSEGELLSFLFLPGLSTAQRVTDLSGRGVGLDVVKSAVETCGGSVRISTQSGQGTSFHLQLPVTRSVIRALIIEVGGEPYALPLLRVERIIKVPLDSVRSIEQRQCIELDGKYVGLVRAHELLETAAAGAADELVVLVISEQGRPFGVIVDRFIGEQDLVVRPLDRRLGKVPNLAAASLLNDGTPVLILDADDLLRSIEQLLARGRPQPVETRASVPSARGRVLVVDDSVIVRELHKQMLMGQGYEVSVAVDGMDGWLALQNGAFDLVVSDIDMPRLNGFELVKRIKQDARTRAIPVIIVSYKDREEDRLRGLEAGADYYLTKSSFHDRALLDAVKDLLGEP